MSWLSALGRRGEQEVAVLNGVEIDVEEQHLIANAKVEPRVGPVRTPRKTSPCEPVRESLIRDDGARGAGRPTTRFGCLDS